MSFSTFDLRIRLKYSKNGRTGVLISRGIGNTNIPIRLFNPSEVTFFKLKVEGKK